MWKKILCLLPSIIILLLTGCWDARDVNERSINIAVGVDYVDGLIEFSGELVKLTKEVEEGAKTSGVYTVHATGKNFEETRVIYNTSLPYPSFLGATRVVIFGQNLAKEGIEAYLNRIDSLYDFRKTLLPVVSRESTKKILNLKPDKDIANGFIIDDILNHLVEDGDTISPNVGDLLSDIAFGPIGYVIPYIGEESGHIKYLGLTVFKESKLVGIIDTKDTPPILYMMAENPRQVELITHPMDDKNKYSFRVAINNREITTAFENDTVVIDISLALKAELRYQYYINEITDEMIKDFENILSTKVTNEIMDMVKRAQKEFECDIFGFGKIFKAQHHKLFKQMDWNNAFLTAKINVDVTTTVVNQNLKSAEK